jgi:hypothetical protein
MQFHLDGARRMTSSDDRPWVDKDSELPRTLARVAVARALAAVERRQPPNGEVHASLQLACNAARQNGLHAESLILMVKDSWRDLADTKILERHESDVALEELITMCILEFYGPNDDERIR